MANSPAAASSQDDEIPPPPWDCSKCIQEGLREIRRCPLLKYEPNEENEDEEGVVAYLENEEVGTGNIKGTVRTSPCFRCPEGCVIEISEVADNMQVLKDANRMGDPDKWTLMEKNVYSILRSHKWIY